MTSPPAARYRRPRLTRVVTDIVIIIVVVMSASAGAAVDALLDVPPSDPHALLRVVRSLEGRSSGGDGGGDGGGAPRGGDDCDAADATQVSACVAIELFLFCCLCVSHTRLTSPHKLRHDRSGSTCIYVTDEGSILV